MKKNLLEVFTVASGTAKPLILRHSAVFNRDARLACRTFTCLEKKQKYSRLLCHSCKTMTIRIFNTNLIHSKFLLHKKNPLMNKILRHHPLPCLSIPYLLPHKPQMDMTESITCPKLHHPYFIYSKSLFTVFKVG